VFLIAPRAANGIKNEAVTDERMKKMMRSLLFIPLVRAQGPGFLVKQRRRLRCVKHPEAAPSIIPGSWRGKSSSGTERSQNPSHPNNLFNPLFLMPIKAHGTITNMGR
jgi:hypothetical protein